MADMARLHRLRLVLAIEAFKADLVGRVRIVTAFLGKEELYPVVLHKTHLREGSSYARYPLVSATLRQWVFRRQKNRGPKPPAERYF